MTQATQDKPILLYDGECGFCSASVRFILRHERDHELLFAPRQSAVGQELLARHGLGPAPGTMVLLESGRVFVRSTATLRICRHLRWPWRAAAWLLMIPAPLRDMGYRIVAGNRQRLSGNVSCAMPSNEEKGRFIG